MSHAHDLSALEGKLFLLRHLATGAKEYCKRENLHKGYKDYEGDEWGFYKGRMLHLVSNELIEISAKLRVIQDTGMTQLPEELAELDEIAIRGLDIGMVEEGRFKLTLRESWNKVIHATSFSLCFSNAKHGHRTYSYWNGRCLLGGTHFGKPWRVNLDVHEWTIALHHYLESISGIIEWDHY